MDEARLAALLDLARQASALADSIREVATVGTIHAVATRAKLACGARETFADDDQRDPPVPTNATTEPRLVSCPLCQDQRFADDMAASIRSGIARDLARGVPRLRDVIARLEREDPGRVVANGFDQPHSYRGYYERLAFEPARDVTVAAMLASARQAVGETFQGYKGGDYTMGLDTLCHLAEWGDCDDGHVLDLDAMLAV